MAGQGARGPAVQQHKHARRDSTEGAGVRVTTERGPHRSMPAIRRRFQKFLTDRQHRLLSQATPALSDRESVERTESVIAKESCILVDSTPKVLEKCVRIPSS